MPIHSESVLKLILDNKCKRIAEVGIWKSKTVKHVLKNTKQVKEYWAIDSWCFFGSDKGRMSRLTPNDWNSLYKYACTLMRYFSALKVLRMESVEAASIFPLEYFDMVYIDADHSMAALERDIIAWIPHIRKDGILSGHDYNSRRHKDVAVVIDRLFGNNITLLEDCVWATKL